jgi:hypothetical protein
LQFESVNPEEKWISYKGIRQTEKIINTKSVLDLQTSLNTSLAPKMSNRNNHILISQLHYCRFISYFIRNLKYLKVSSKNRTKLTLLLHKHMAKLITLLSNDKTNHFQLQEWESFKESKKYISTQNTMKEYGARYQKEYAQFLKEVDITVLQQFNRGFVNLEFD